MGLEQKLAKKHEETICKAEKKSFIKGYYYFYETS